MRAVTGISVTDIGKYGIQGGPHSVVNEVKGFVERSLGFKF